MNKRLLNFALLLTSFALLGQRKASGQQEPWGQDVAAIEFTTTSNASQVGVNLVAGYQFTVRSPVILTGLGAVLNSDSTKPVFSVLPGSMPVGLWDDSRFLIVSATVSSADPKLGHFNYRKVAPIQLYPGVNYTIAGVVPKGWSVLSDVPAMTPGSVVTYGGAKTLISQTLAFPSGDAIGLRQSYLGPSFTYTGATDPVARAGADQDVTYPLTRAGAERDLTSRETVTLDGSASFSPANRSLTYKWTLVLVPAGSAAALASPNTPTTSLRMDRAGVYVAQLICNDGFTDSAPSTVSLFAASGLSTPRRRMD